MQAVRSRLSCAGDAVSRCGSICSAISLKRAGRTVPQLKAGSCPRPALPPVRYLRRRTLIGVGLDAKSASSSAVKSVRNSAENERRAALVIALRKRFQSRVGKARETRSGEYSRRPVRYRWRWRMPRKPCALISCAYIIHIFTTSAVVLIASSIV